MNEENCPGCGHDWQEHAFGDDGCGECRYEIDHDDPQAPSQPCRRPVPQDLAPAVLATPGQRLALTVILAVGPLLVLAIAAAVVAVLVRVGWWDDVPLPLRVFAAFLVIAGLVPAFRRVNQPVSAPLLDPRATFPLRRGEHPAFWDLMDQVAADLGKPLPVRKVVLTPVSLITVERDHGRAVLTVGLPLVTMLAAHELRVLIALNLACVQERESLWSRASRMAWAMANHAGPVVDLPLRAYAVLVTRRWMAQSRHHLDQAVDAVTRAVGVRTVESALRRAETVRLVDERYLDTLDGYSDAARLHGPYREALTELESHYPDLDKQVAEQIEDGGQSWPDLPAAVQDVLERARSVPAGALPAEPQPQPGRDLLTDPDRVERAVLLRVGLPDADWPSVARGALQALWELQARPVAEQAAAQGLAPSVRTVLDLAEAGDLGKLADGLVHTRFRREHERKETVEALLPSVLHGALLAAGALDVRIDWATGQITAKDVAGNDLAEIEMPVPEPGQVPALREFLIGQGADLDRNLVAERGTGLRCVLPGLVLQRKAIDLLVAGDGLLFLPHGGSAVAGRISRSLGGPEDETRIAGLWRSDLQELKRADGATWVPFDQLASASMPRLTASRLMFETVDGRKLKIGLTAQDLEILEDELALLLLTVPSTVWR